MNKHTYERTIQRQEVPQERTQIATSPSSFLHQDSGPNQGSVWEVASEWLIAVIAITILTFGGLQALLACIVVLLGIGLLIRILLWLPVFGLLALLATPIAGLSGMLSGTACLWLAGSGVLAIVLGLVLWSLGLKPDDL
jgi:hypothetical protein